jgi:hypothetical protein
MIMSISFGILDKHHLHLRDIIVFDACDLRLLELAHVRLMKRFALPSDRPFEGVTFSADPENTDRGISKAIGSLSRTRE